MGAWVFFIIIIISGFNPFSIVAKDRPYTKGVTFYNINCVSCIPTHLISPAPAFFQHEIQLLPPMADFATAKSAQVELRAKPHGYQPRRLVPSAPVPSSPAIKSWSERESRAVLHWPAVAHRDGTFFTSLSAYCCCRLTLSSAECVIHFIQISGHIFFLKKEEDEMLARMLAGQSEEITNRPQLILIQL